MVLVLQIPRDRLLDNPRALAILDGDEKGMGLTTFMGSDRRLVAYPCRKGTLLNIVAIVVRLNSAAYKLCTTADLITWYATAGLGSGEFYRGVARTGRPRKAPQVFRELLRRRQVHPPVRHNPVETVQFRS